MKKILKFLFYCTATRYLFFPTNNKWQRMKLSVIDVKGPDQFKTPIRYIVYIAKLNDYHELVKKQFTDHLCLVILEHWTDLYTEAAS